MIRTAIRIRIVNSIRTKSAPHRYLLLTILSLLVRFHHHDDPHTCKATRRNCNNKQSLLFRPLPFELLDYLSRIEATMASIPTEGAQVGVGFSHQTLLTASLVGFLGVAAVVYSLIVSRVKTNLDDDDDNDKDGQYEAKLARANVANLNRAQRRARAHYLMKQQRKANNHRNNDIDNNNTNNNENHQEPNAQPDQPVLSRKERQKAAKAVEREERHRFQEQRQRQQELAQKEAALERVRRQQLAAESAAEAKRIQQSESMLQKQKEEEAKRIFLSCPEKTLSVDEWRRRSSRRVDYLEAIGAEFGTSSHAVYQRIQQLLEERRVTGILDSKQFIFLSEDELQAIADQIYQKGAVTLSDVVELCSPIIAS